MKLLLRVILAILIAVVAALLWATYSEAGARRVLDFISSVTPVEIEHRSGRLGGEMRLHRVHYASSDVIVTLSDVSLDLDKACLWRSVFCFSTLQAASLNIDIPAGPAVSPNSVPTPAQTPTQASPLKKSNLLKFPVTLEASELVLDKVVIKWSSGSWQQGPAVMGLRLHGSSIEIDGARLSQPQLELLATESSTESEAFTPTHIDLPLHLKVTGLILEEPVLKLSESQLELQQLNFSGVWRNTKLRLEQLSLDAGQFGETTLQGALNFSGNWPLQVEVNVTPGTESPIAQLQGRAISTSLEGNLAALAFKLSAPGQPALSAQGQLNALDANLPFTADLQLSELDDLSVLQIEGLPQYLEALRLETPITAELSGSRAKQQFKVETNATGVGYESVQILLQGSHAQQKVEVDTLTLQDNDADSELRISGELDLSAGLRWSMTLATDHLSPPSFFDAAKGYVAGSLNSQGFVDAKSWQAEISAVDLKGMINNLPAQVTGFAGLRSAMEFLPSALLADVNGAQMSLSHVGTAGSSGELRIDIEDLAHWRSDARGQLQVQALVNTSADVPYTFSGALQNIRWQGLVLDEGSMAGKYNPEFEHAVTAQATLQNFAMGGLTLSTLQLKGDGDAQDQTLTLTSSGDIEGELAFTGSAQHQDKAAQPKQGSPATQWQGTISPTLLRTTLGNWELQEAIALTASVPGASDEGNITVAAHCWQQQHLRVCPGEWRLGSAGGGELSVNGDMAFMEGVIPADSNLSGALDINLLARWSTTESLYAQGTSRIRDLKLTQQLGEDERASIAWEKSDGQFTYDSSGLNLQLGLHRDGAREAFIKLLMPLERDAPMQGTLDFEQLRLAGLAAFIPGLNRVSGEIDGSVSIAGTVAAPRLGGKVQLSDGRAALTGNPTELQALNIAVQLQGDQAALTGTGLLGGGNANINGTFYTQPQARLELEIDGQNHNILYPPSAKLQVSEKLKVIVDGKGLAIAGDIVIEDGTVEFEQLPEGGVPLSADIVEVDAAGYTLQEDRPFDISLDVNIKVRNRFMLTGSLLKTRLGGELNLKQKAGQPLQVFGSLSTTGGEVRAYQTQLVIKRGLFNFSGSPTNPTLDVRAERTLRSYGVTVGLHIHGPLEENLALDTYSDPNMPLNEAMSYLIRGRPLDTGAGADGTALALSLASTVINRTSLVAALNDVPGLNSVTFGAEGSEDETAATVSGYIGERIYLSYGFGIYEPINILTARLYLRTQLWLEVVSRLENSIDLYYSFDID